MGTGAWLHHSFIHSFNSSRGGGRSVPGTGWTLGMNQADVVIPQRSTCCSDGRDPALRSCVVRAAAEPLLHPESQLLVSRMDTPPPTSWARGLVERDKAQKASHTVIGAFSKLQVESQERVAKN